MILVDTSYWVHQIRKDGDATVRARVDSLLATGQAAWCAMVRLELWSGVRSDHDRKLLRAYEEVIHDLAITDDVWSSAQQLASRCRAGGITAQATDLLIAACALHHRVPVETADSDFARILAA